MTLVHKIKVVNTLRSGMSETSAGVLFRWYFVLNPNFPLIICFNA
jgi:hypothetical protein